MLISRSFNETAAVGTNHDGLDFVSTMKLSSSKGSQDDSYHDCETQRKSQ